MYLSLESEAIGSKHEFLKRQNSTYSTNSTSPSPSPIPTQPQQSSQTWTYVVVAVIGVVLLTIGIIFLYMRMRRLKIAGKQPKYIPTQFLRRRWDAWKPKGKYSNIERNGSESGPSSVALRTTEETRETTETSGVNRNTSIRSIMTLPAYSQTPKFNEEVIGREGERAGIDTVLELPENADEEEERREAEMESLYQIRQARRREIAEREERRRERREARERNDWTRLEELRREQRARRDQPGLTNLQQNSASNVNLTAEMLIAEHTSRGRDRRVSSVSYAQVGQVRHNGTRIRSNSHESEQSGLLSGAAPMGSHTRNGSEATLLTIGGLPQPHYRDRSDSGATSISTAASSFENVCLPAELSRPTSRTVASSHHTTDSISEVDVEEVDLGNERLVISGTDSESSPHPPDYEGHDWGDAPGYVSRVNSMAITPAAADRLNRALSSASRTDSLSIVPPSITIETPTGPNTPVAPASARRAPSPVAESREH